MMPILFSFSLFYLSFLPLWLSILFVDAKAILLKESVNLLTERITVAAIFLVFVVCSVVVRNGLKIKSLENTKRYRLSSAKEQKTITTEYLLSYILPLFAFDFTKWDQVFLFLIFFSMMCFLCLRHNYYSTNIVLEFFGYRTYDCVLINQSEASCERTVISKIKMAEKIGQSFHMRALNNEFLLGISEIEER